MKKHFKMIAITGMINAFMLSGAYAAIAYDPTIAIEKYTEYSVAGVNVKSNGGGNFSANEAKKVFNALIDKNANLVKAQDDLNNLRTSIETKLMTAGGVVESAHSTEELINDLIGTTAAAGTVPQLHYDTLKADFDDWKKGLDKGRTTSAEAKAAWEKEISDKEAERKTEADRHAKWKNREKAARLALEAAVGDKDKYSLKKVDGSDKDKKDVSKSSAVGITALKDQRDDREAARQGEETNRIAAEGKYAKWKGREKAARTELATAINDASVYDGGKKAYLSTGITALKDQRIAAETDRDDWKKDLDKGMATPADAKAAWEADVLAAHAGTAIHPDVEDVARALDVDTTLAPDQVAAEVKRRFEERDRQAAEESRAHEQERELARQAQEEEARAHAQRLADIKAAEDARQAEQARLDGLASQIKDFADAKNWAAAADIVRRDPSILDNDILKNIAKAKIERLL